MAAISSSSSSSPTSFNVYHTRSFEEINSHILDFVSNQPVPHVYVLSEEIMNYMTFISVASVKVIKDEAGHVLKRTYKLDKRGNTNKAFSGYLISQSEREANRVSDLSKAERIFNRLVRQLHGEVRTSELYADLQYLDLRKYHFDRSRHLMLRAVDNLPSYERVIILGGGTLEPYEQLSKYFKKIICIDMFASLMPPRLVSLKNKGIVEFIEADLSGGLCNQVKEIFLNAFNNTSPHIEAQRYKYTRDVLSKFLGYIPTSSTRLPKELLGSASLVISSCVASMLVHTPEAVLQIFFQETFNSKEKLSSIEILEKNESWKTSLKALEHNFESLRPALMQRIFQFHLKEIRQLLCPGGKVYFSDTFARRSFNVEIPKHKHNLKSDSTIIIPSMDMDQYIESFEIPEEDTASWIWCIDPLSGFGYSVRALTTTKKTESETLSKGAIPSESKQ